MVAPYVVQDPAPISDAGTTALHKRASVTNVEALFSSFITGGIPSWAGPGQTDPVSVPKAVMLQVESADAALGKVFLTFDGISTAGATLGFECPVAPNSVTIPGVGAITKMRAVASVAGPIHVQCFFLP